MVYQTVTATGSLSKQTGKRERERIDREIPNYNPILCLVNPGVVVEGHVRADNATQVIDRENKKKERESHKNAETKKIREEIDLFFFVFAVEHI